MGELRDLRIKAGLTQPQVAEYIKVNISAISNYENNVSLPVLEDMLLLEKKFNKRISWREDLTPYRKHEVVQSIIELCEKFPVPAVVEFANRMFHREPTPEKLIIFYAQATGNNEEPLEPVGIKFKSK